MDQLNIGSPTQIRKDLKIAHTVFYCINCISNTLPIVLSLLCYWYYMVVDLFYYMHILKEI